MSTDIKKYIKLLESIDTLKEGRADDLLKQSLNSVQTRYSDSEHDIETLTKTTNTIWRKMKSAPEFTHFPNSWKIFLAEVVKSNMLETLLDMTGDDSLKKKIKHPTSKMLNAQGVFRYFVHLTGINYHKIQEFNPLESNNPIDELTEYEQEYVDLSNENFIKPTGDESVLVKFGDTAWYDLGRGSCDDEADAMGHCGNKPSESQGDRIFSLRKIIKVGNEEFHKPHLTFIFNDGFLGEMKGRANEKPAERYHKYIMALLKLPIITGVVGGGYEPMNNFELDDLSDAQINELRKVKGDDFVDGAGNTLLPIKALSDRLLGGDRTVIKALEEKANEYIEDNIMGYYASEYEITSTHDSDFTVYNPGFDHWEIATIRDLQDLEFHDYGSIDNYADFVEEHFTGNLVDSIERYIISVYKEDIKDYFGLEDDEVDADFINDEFHEIVDNVADDVKSVLERLHADASESGTMAEIVSSVESALSDFLSQLNFVDMPVYEFVDGQDFKIKNNDVYEYLRNLSTLDEESLDDHFKIDAPYHGYQGFDNSMLESDEIIKDAFDMENIELDYYKKEDE